MYSTVQLIDLLGAAALLLWGLRLIKTGVLRAYGAVLRQWLSQGSGGRVVAAFWGFLATLGLQSSTASAVIIASFTARGIIKPRMAQAMMLGANLGTAIVTVVLSADVHWVGSAAIFLGVVMHNVSEGNRLRNMGRAVLGLGLMLLALQLLGTVTAPLRESETVVAMLSGLGNAPVFAILLAAGLAILASSSLAVVVLVMMLAAAGVVGPALALWLVAGANLGGAVPPWLAVRSEGLAARRLTLANLLVRGTGALVVLVAADPLADLLGGLIPGAAHFVVGAHVAFNAALLLIFLPLVGPLCTLIERLVPASRDPAASRSQLDDSLLPMPAMALPVAARETLRLGDLVVEMLERTLAAMRTSDEAALAEVSRLEERVDQQHEAIKLYVARLSRGELTEEDARWAGEIVSYAINLEHIGDIVEGGIAEITAKKLRNKLVFSLEGQAEIAAFFQHTLENLRMAQAIFLSRDAALARRLVARKVESRRIEAESAEHHMQRMRTGRTETLETSTLHLDILRDLKRVNAHIASVAYPILEGLGLLEESRVKEAAQ
ncbi:Na/Pi cotransporter family protein (plasmid) [Paracoccus denitrificans]|uniref:Na/Pi cotransporter family protein n=1 Tax=Paracoccus denitrificans TaxID=266 RepID=UPI001E40C384|nr:Na/Pi cotransporter family protein [Paracoccus denitrificans]UFS68219.1 Na/Pi cotransporter family protein [Paracoccus denitrificans]